MEIEIQNIGIAEGAHEELIHRYERRLAESPNDVTNHFLLGRIHGILGHQELARRSFERALIIDSRFGWAHQGQGVLSIRSGHIEQGLDHLERATRCSPEDPRLLIATASILFELANKRRESQLYKKSETLLLSARHLQPRNAEILLSLSLIHARTNRIQSAIALTWEVIAEDPSLASARYQLGFLQEQAGQKKRALEAYRQALTLNLTPLQRQRIQARQLHLKNLPETSRADQKDPPILSDRLTSKDPTLRRGAWKKLLLNTNPNHISVIESGLKDEDAVIRVYCLRALASLRITDSIPQIFEMVETDPDARVRGAAVAALGALNDRKIVSKLIGRFLHESSPYVCEQLDTTLALLTRDHALPGGPQEAKPLFDSESGRKRLHQAWTAWMKDSR
jgi:tetratricopeptide (TPR) repeat protein